MNELTERAGQVAENVLRLSQDDVSSISVVLNRVMGVVLPLMEETEKVTRQLNAAEERFRLASERATELGVKNDSYTDEIKVLRQKLYTLQHKTDTVIAPLRKQMQGLRDTLKAVSKERDELLGKTKQLGDAISRLMAQNAPVVVRE